MFSDREAEVLTAVAESPAGLRLRDAVIATSAPTSSVQRALEALLRTGLVVRIEGGRTRWAVAPDVPIGSLRELVDWRITKSKADRIRELVSGIIGVVPQMPDVRAILETALSDASVREKLLRSARELIWWQSAERTLEQPERLIVQAMARGTDRDLAVVEDVFGESVMRRALATAPPGLFSQKAWNYWHLRYGYGRIPQLPVRS